MTQGFESFLDTAHIYISIHFIKNQYFLKNYVNNANSIEFNMKIWNYM